MNNNHLCEQCKQNRATSTITFRSNIAESFTKRVCADCKKKLTTGAGNQQDPISSLLDSFSNLFGDGDNNSIFPEFSNSRSSGNASELDKFGTNLNDLVLNGKIDPLIGRSKEIEEAIFILNRRMKNNPVLIGEPGVGKTSIVHGIAQKIVQGDVPKNLKDKIIYSLNMTDLVEGTTYRGQFESRVKKILDITKANPNIILFIDELHTIMGAGSVKESKNDFANIIKPSLANGELQIIGATTSKEFDIIEKDGAMERRIQKIVVEEPSKEETLEILKGVKHLYEKHHNVSYSDDVLSTIVNLSSRYIFYRNMPDKAIDLLDTVGSLVNIRGFETNGDNPNIERYFELHRQEQEALSKNDFRLAYELSQEREKLSKDSSIKVDGSLHISLDDVKLTVEKMTNIPVQDVDSEGKVSLSNLENDFKTMVMGQDNAVSVVTKAIKRNRVNIRNTNKPSSFLFAGPTGVGKTELAKAVSRIIFKTEDALVRFDMSEFMEEHSVSKLIGAPPGYVGHEDGGKLTNAIKHNPYSVILLDEIEKAHPKVYNAFLQILDDGVLTDSKGKKVDFSNAIIIFTSNIGSGELKHTGFFNNDNKNFLETAVKAHFKPEFINRLDSIVSFNHLNKEVLVSIFEKLVAPIKEGLENYNFSLTISEEAKSWILEKGYNQSYGARFLNRTIVEHIEDVLTDYIINNDELTDVVLKVDAENNKTFLEPVTIDINDDVELEKEDLNQF